MDNSKRSWSLFITFGVSQAELAETRMNFRSDFYDR
jgi:hypothetical protein